MGLNKSDILKALETVTVAGEGKNMVESGAVRNVMTFADEVVVDITIASPAMHIKKRAEEEARKKEARGMSQRDKTPPPVGS